MMTVVEKLAVEQALELIDRVVAASQADGVFVSIEGGEEALSRFAGNQITQNVNQSRFALAITSYFGAGHATASTSETDLEAIEATVRCSEALARIAPADPEAVALLAPQSYDARQAGFDEATAHTSPLVRSEIIQGLCAQAEAAKVTVAGTLGSESRLRAVGNSLGLRAAARTTTARFGLIARIEDGSSWGERTGWQFDGLRCAELAGELIERAAHSRNPRSIAPGTYPVVLHPAAFAELLSWVGGNFDARAADEGRSFLSGPAGGNRIGETLFSPLVQLVRDPAHPLLCAPPFQADGLPNTCLEIVKDGIPQTLSYSRYWAQKQGVPATGAFTPLAMAGGQASLEALVAGMERGVLIHRAWYVRSINQRELSVTGMTRDGTFWIEDGRIAYPIKNLRFNQSLPQLLRTIEALGEVERHGALVVPAVRASSFQFSSVTDSI